MSEAGDVKEKVRTEAHRTAEEAAQKTKVESERLIDEAQRKAQEVVVARKEAAAEFIHDMCEAAQGATDVLNKQGHHDTARLLKSAAGELDRLSTSISKREINSLLEDFRDMAYRKPTLFFGGALLVGFGAARFLSASASHGRHQPQRTPQRTPSSGDPIGGASATSYGGPIR
jgi:galactokinase/mevalonate kinase-like predicted kinase